MTRAAALLVFALLLCQPAAAGVQVAHYDSGGKKIAVDVYRATKQRRHAAIVILHGSGGYLGNLTWLQHNAFLLCDAGYDVYVIHYMERTGTWFTGDMDEMRKNFPAWMDCVEDGLKFVRARDPAAGLLGFSLGGFLAVAVGARDPRVRAVVEISAGWPPGLPEDVRRMPPTLILHGDNDHVVSVQFAFSLATDLKLAERIADFKIYRHQGHGLTDAAATDAERRESNFFRQYLRAVSGSNISPTR